MRVRSSGVESDSRRVVVKVDTRAVSLAVWKVGLKVVHWADLWVVTSVVQRAVLKAAVRARSSVVELDSRLVARRVVVLADSRVVLSAESWDA